MCCKISIKCNQYKALEIEESAKDISMVFTPVSMSQHIEGLMPMGKVSWPCYAKGKRVEKDKLLGNYHVLQGMHYTPVVWTDCVPLQ